MKNYLKPMLLLIFFAGGGIDYVCAAEASAGDSSKLPIVVGNVLSAGDASDLFERLADADAAVQAAHESPSYTGSPEQLAICQKVIACAQSLRRSLEGHFEILTPDDINASPGSFGLAADVDPAELSPITLNAHTCAQTALKIMRIAMKLDSLQSELVRKIPRDMVQG